MKFASPLTNINYKGILASIFEKISNSILNKSKPDNFFFSYHLFSEIFLNKLHKMYLNQVESSNSYKINDSPLNL